jgi:NMD protein affecting ribosome stability and mRNA decay
VSDRHRFQATCDHAKAQVLRREQATRQVGDLTQSFTVLHMYCPRCGAYFARDVWGAILPEREAS